MAYSVEDLVNLALREIGYPTPIGNINEGSKAARVAIECYGNERDTLLRLRDWDFARQTVSLGNPVKTAPPGGYGITGWNSTFPAIPWIYEYAYPSCIEVRGLMPTPIFIPETLPRYILFEKTNDATLSAPGILTNLANANASITAHVNDPAQWTDPGFVNALVDALAAAFLVSLGDARDPNVMVLAERRAQASAALGNARD